MTRQGAEAAAASARGGKKPPAKPRGRGYMSLVWFFGVYAFFKYVSDKEIW